MLTETQLFGRKGIPIKDSLVLITGASQGIGASLAEECVKRDAKVILLARSSDKLQKLKEKLDKLSKKPNTVHVFAVDCGDYKAVAKVAETIKAQIGIPDVIVNNAGVGRWRTIYEMESKEIEECIRVPYLSSAFVTRAFIKEMMERNSGSIIQVNSPMGYFLLPGANAYGVARWAQRAFTGFVRQDLKYTKINVQEIVFGLVESNYFQNNPDSFSRIPKAGLLMGKCTTQEAGKLIIRAIESGKEFSAHPWIWTWILYLHSWMGSHLIWMLQKVGLAD